MIRITTETSIHKYSLNKQSQIRFNTMRLTCQRFVNLIFFEQMLFNFIDSLPLKLTVSLELLYEGNKHNNWSTWSSLSILISYLSNSLIIIVKLNNMRFD